MPTYEYVCRSCDTHLEVVQRFDDPALTDCSTCGGALRKVFGNIGIAFKGSGFYKNDSRSVAGTRAGSDKGEGSKESGGDGKGDGKGDGTTGGSDAGSTKDAGSKNKEAASTSSSDSASASASSGSSSSPAAKSA
ncbi:MAG: FmdB family transcriptional regulator [Actinomycetota bacterium]|nr:FmdB family transcriptional regulator [Actinomycetota bacterium]